MQIKYHELSTPTGWTKDKIGKRLKLNYGKSQATIKADDGAIPIYGTGGLMGYGNQALADGDSVLIGRKGTLGNPLYIDHPFWPVDTTYYTSDFDGSMKWFYYMMQTVGLSSLNEATGVPSLSRQTFYNVEILFPPPEQQTAIADILTTVDQAIEQTEALIAKQRRIKAGLLHDLLTRGIDEHGRLRDPSTHRFKPSPVGLVPEEWEVATLGSVVDRYNGVIQTGPFGSQLHAEEYTKEGVPFVMPQDISSEGALLLDSAAKIPQHRAYDLRRHLLKENDVLFARRGDLSRCAAVRVNDIAVAGSGCMLVRVPKSAMIGEWLVRAYKHERSQRQIMARAVGSTMVNLNSTLLRDLIVMLPKNAEQERILFVLGQAYELDFATQLELDKLATLKVGLMQDLLSGRVTVAELTKSAHMC